MTHTCLYSRSSPPEPITFEFCRDLLGDGVGSLQAGQLAVDSLTVDSLRLRLTDVEHRLREVTAELREKQNLLNQHETEVVNIRKNSPQDSNIASRWAYFLHQWHKYYTQKMYYPLMNLRIHTVRSIEIYFVKGNWGIIMIQ